jgi:hypothetical protein
MHGSVVLASGVEASKTAGTVPGRSTAAGVAARTAPASSVANAWAPVSSCRGTVVGRETVSVTLVRSKPPRVPRLQASLPGADATRLAWSGGGEALWKLTPGWSVSVRSTPLRGLACSL